MSRLKIVCAVAVALLALTGLVGIVVGSDSETDETHASGCTLTVEDDRSQFELDCGEKGAVTVTAWSGRYSDGVGDGAFELGNTYHHPVLDPEILDSKGRTGKGTDAVKSVVVMHDGEFRVFHTLGGPNCLTIVDAVGQVVEDRCQELDGSTIEMWEKSPIDSPINA